LTLAEAGGSAGSFRGARFWGQSGSGVLFGFGCVDCCCDYDDSEGLRVGARGAAYELTWEKIKELQQQERNERIRKGLGENGGLRGGVEIDVVVMLNVVVAGVMAMV
jgi:hypothetical protein